MDQDGRDIRFVPEADIASIPPNLPEGAEFKILDQS